MKILLEDDLENENQYILYIFTANGFGSKKLTKIGISKNPKRRLISCRSYYDPMLKKFGVYRSDNPRLCEKLIKEKFKDFRRKGTEFFCHEPKEIEDFLLSLAGTEKLCGGSE